MIDRLRRLQEVTAAIGADGAIVPILRTGTTSPGSPGATPRRMSRRGTVSKDSAILFTGPTNLPWSSAVRPPVKRP